MPRVVAVGTAVPPYEISQNTARQFAREMFTDAFRDIERLLQVFDHANIQKRHLCVPIEWFKEAHAFHEKNETYSEVARELSVQAIEKCLKCVDLSVQQIDHLIFVSTTGIATPSIDAHLANRLNMSHHLKRTPIWGLGCAGGAVGLSRAYEYAQAFPRSCVMLVAVELCSLTFQRNDLSKSNLIATSLFADGAAAALVCGDDIQKVLSGGPRIVRTMSTLWQETEDIMGWTLKDDGLHVVFSKHIPTFVQTLMRPNVEQFLATEQLTIEHIDRFVTHPGGMKVIKALEEALHLSAEKTAPAKDILARFGNMSSASVLFVLEQIMQQAQAGEYGLMTALGPGFSSEQLLLQW